MKAAMFVIDLQKAFQNDDTRKSMKSACDYINAAIPLFRKKKWPIVWVQHKEESEGVRPGEPGFDFVDELKPEEGDHRIVKEYGNTFNKTGALDILRREGVDTVLLTGFCAEYCVLSTYRGAQDLDLTPIILRDSLASDKAEHIAFVERISSLMTFGVLAKIMA